MKTWTVANWSLRLAVVMLPLTGGCVRESVNSTPAIVTNQNPAAFTEAAASPDEQAPPQAAARDLENAPARLVSTPATAAPVTKLSSSAAEVARLAQSGVDENVMLAFVNNSTSAFELGSDQIIYLNDIGVPGNVATAMIQRDQVLKAASPAPAAPAPVYSYQPAPVQIAAPETVNPQPGPAIAQEAPPPQANVTATYFYDELSPYGNWVEVEGYGRCWQPSAVVVDRSWTPYVDRGHWVYSDCGWYWASDYSWGWAPFHYGRWFRHNSWGWCWAPDTVWGPSWVSWRYNAGYCGWAPLPPTACYQPGGGFTYYGRSVGVGFGFGLGADYFTFVAADRFCDPQPFRHRVPRGQVTQIFHNTTIINPVVEDRGNPRYHRGIPTKHLAEVTRTEIKPVKIQETTSAQARGRGDDRDRNRGTMTVFRPTLPQPPAHTTGNRIGVGVKPATPDTVIRRFDADATMHRGIPRKTEASAAVSQVPSERRSETVPIFKAPGAGNNPSRNPRGPERTPAAEPNKELPARLPVLRETAPAVTSPKTPPPQNSVPPKRQPTAPAPRQFVAPAHTQNQPARPEQPLVRDDAQRGQPRQEKVFVRPSAPAAPVQPQSAPQLRTYQAPVQPPTYPPMTTKEPRGNFRTAPERAVPARVPEASAPPATRVAVPQVSTPRIETPRVESRPAPAMQVPSAAAARPAANSEGGSRDKRQRDGNPR